MDVSIIIVSYNTHDLLKACLNSIMAITNGVQFEIIVVDNNSSDGSVEMVSADFPSVRIIRNHDNVGFGRANNIAILQSSAKYVFLLNSDTELRNNTVKILFDFMDTPENEKIFCCGGALYGGDGLPTHSYGNLPSILEILVSNFGLCRFMKRYYRDKLSIALPCTQSTPFTVPYVLGADMFIRRSALELAGKFDEDFFLYFEETELSFRHSRKGYYSYIVPEAEIVHLEGKSCSKRSVKAMAILEKSRLLYFKKCHGVFAAYLAKLILMLAHGIRLCLFFRANDLTLLRIYSKL